jgi:hypothetical protein
MTAKTSKTNKSKTTTAAGWDIYGPAYPKDFIAETGIPEGWQDRIRSASGSMLFINGNDRMVCLSVTPPGYGVGNKEGEVYVQTCGKVSKHDIETVRALAVKPFMAWFEAEGYAVS